ncbi:helicase associated domain-containing protein [Streptomyces sp. NRRL F-2747]|uniref:helicase associated domain-containing protein n=1 Tax=Streptomyces sp. NRRL F-2747 TaxID=1463843 RepID=UPI000D141CBD|nr:helicase associated domain-containing protein [Streptomyces sp. NRRL F-2747]
MSLTPLSRNREIARGAAAFQTGIQALAQYVEREGGGLPGRSHVERLPDGNEHRTGVWLANQRQRRDRLDAGQLRALAELGVDWAGSAV